MKTVSGTRPHQNKQAITTNGSYTGHMSRVVVTGDTCYQLTASVAHWSLGQADGATGHIATIRRVCRKDIRLADVGN